MVVQICVITAFSVVLMKSFSYSVLLTLFKDSNPFKQGSNFNRTELLLPIIWEPQSLQHREVIPTYVAQKELNKFRPQSL